MQTWNSTSAWIERRRALTDRSLGFVPTMGALHEGHASLVQRCRAENDVVVVSIFVNPSQFTDPADLTRYPRTLGDDLVLLKRLGADEVLVPSASDMYPHGYRLRVDSVDSAQVMESLYRPGFLQGVMTVVMKLFNLVHADRAYFGEKDYQQLKAVQDMVEEFCIGTRIIPCPTIREESGLAMSSRNTLLSPGAREKATALFRALSTGTSPAAVRATLEAQGFSVEYAEEHWGRRLVAVLLDGIRLIDNVPIPPAREQNLCC